MYGAKSGEELFPAKVYGALSLSMVISTLAALAVIMSDTLMMTFIMEDIYFHSLVGSELLLIAILTMTLGKLPIFGARLAVVALSVTTGMTLSVIMLRYAPTAIFQTFIIASLAFGAAALHDFKFRVAAGPYRRYIFMVVSGVAAATTINLLTALHPLDWYLTYGVVALCTLLAAVDSKRIFEVADKAAALRGVPSKAFATHSALALYLDIVNPLGLALRQLTKRI